MTQTTVTFTGSHARSNAGSPILPQDVLGQMSFDGVLAVSAVELPDFIDECLDGAASPVYQVVDLLADAEFETTDREAAVAEFSRLCRACIRALSGTYTIEVGAPEGASIDEGIDAYLSILNALYGTYGLSAGGRKYARIVALDTASAFAFVERSTGRLWKADGWKRPSRVTYYGNVTGTVTHLPA